MSLDDIGFYTLSEARARDAGPTAPLARCELILTSRCNFRCPYCRHAGGDDIPLDHALRVLDLWADHDVRHVRFSGGEPSLYRGLDKLVAHAKARGARRIAVSTNGSARQEVYAALIAAGADDFSVSLDACCAEDGDRMAGGRKGAWARVVATIEWLASRVYTTVGVVLTAENAATAAATVAFAHDLGVADIRVIPAAQSDARLPPLDVAPELLAAHPILRYRCAALQAGRPVRGLRATDPPRCWLTLDDMAVMGQHHYPCIIYLREGGPPIGPLSNNVRAQRSAWAVEHDTHADPICRRNCLDVCVDYNTAAHRVQSVRLADMAGGRTMRPPSGLPRRWPAQPMGTPTGAPACDWMGTSRTDTVPPQGQ